MASSVTCLLVLVVAVCYLQTVICTVIIEPSGTVIREAGESITLSCQVTASAGAIVTFMKDSTWKPQKYARRKRSLSEESPIRSKRDVHMLDKSFPEATPWDTGRWICLSNDGGNNEAAYADLVVVQVGKSQDMVVYEQDMVGGAIWCSCVNLDPRLCEILWKKDGERLPPGEGALDINDDDIPDVFASDDTQGLVFLHNRASDSGTYTCSAQVTVGGESQEMPARSIDVRMETDKERVNKQGFCDRLNEVNTDGSALHHYEIADPKLYSGVFTFEVQAAEDVIVRLKPRNNASTDFIEIILGSESNTKSKIIRYVGSHMPVTVEADTYRILASYEVRIFTVIYAYDMVEVRRGTERTPFISLNQRHGRVFNDPAIYVRVVEYGTGNDVHGNGVHGSFFVCNPEPREPWLILTAASELKSEIVVAVVVCICILIAITLAVIPKWHCPAGVPVDPEKNVVDDKPEAKDAATTSTDKATKDMLPLAPSYGDPVEYAEKRHKKHKKHRKHKKKRSWSPKHDSG